MNKNIILNVAQFTVINYSVGFLIFDSNLTGLDNDCLEG